MCQFTSLLTEHFDYLGTPRLVICVANVVIWRKQKSPFENNNHVNIEVKLAKTLLLITGASLFTWLPFQIVNFLFELDVGIVISTYFGSRQYL